MLFISGWACGADSMEPLAKAFRAGFDVTVLSGVNVLAAKEITDADIIVGWSMGGMLAMEHLPVSCKKLILLSSTAKFCASENYPCGISGKALRHMIIQLKRNPDAALKEFYKNASSPHRSRICENSSHSAEELLEGLNYLFATDLREKVPTLGIPTLLLHGKEDIIIPPSASEWLHSQLPASSLNLFEKEGHALPASHLKGMVDSIASFV